MNNENEMGLNYDLLAIIQMIKNDSGHNPGKKQLQKLIYLVQAKGVDLGYEYGIHFYGPFSEDLSRDLMSLCVFGEVDFTNVNNTHEIVPSITPVEMSLNEDDIKVVKNIIYDYRSKTPYDLELLTTTHFIAENLGGTKSDILTGVKKIKGDKYRDSSIIEAIDLVRNEFIHTH